MTELNGYTCVPISERMGQYKISVNVSRYYTRLWDRLMDASNLCGSLQIKKQVYVEPLAGAKRSNIAFFKTNFLKL